MRGKLERYPHTSKPFCRASAFLDLGGTFTYETDDRSKSALCNENRLLRFHRMCLLFIGNSSMQPIILELPELPERRKR